MFAYYFWYHFLPFTGAALFGLAIALIARRRSVAAPHRSARILTAVGSVAALLIGTAPFFPSLYGFVFEANLGNYFNIWSSDSPWKLSFPLIAGAVAMTLIVLTPAPPAGAAGAELFPRSILAFTRRSALLIFTALVVISGTLTVLVGKASSPDDEGRYRMYVVDAGVIKGAVEFYGWYYSVPAAIVFGLLVITMIISLWRIARPPLGNSAAAEIATRKLRSSWVMLTGIGAMLMHLSGICRFLYSTSTLRMSGRGSAHAETAYSWPPFAALGPALFTTAFILSVLGFAVWAYIFWSSAMGARRGRG